MDGLIDPCISQTKTALGEGLRQSDMLTLSNGAVGDLAQKGWRMVPVPTPPLLISSGWVF